MKNLFIYIQTFFKTLFRQLFNSSEIKKVEQENVIGKMIKDFKIQNKGKEHKSGKKFNMRFFRRGMRLDRFQRPCLFCKESMWVSMGQLAYWHAKCRTKGRRLSLDARYGRA